MGLYIEGMKMPKDDVNAFKRVTLCKRTLSDACYTFGNSNSCQIPT